MSGGVYTPMLRVFCARCGRDLAEGARCDCDTPTEAVQTGARFMRTDCAGARFVRVVLALEGAGMSRDRASCLAAQSAEGAVS